MRSRGPRRVRSRRALLWGMVTYCILQISFSVASSQFWPWIREPVYGRKLVRLRKRLNHAPSDELEIVAIGSSRTLNGLQGDLAGSLLSRDLGRPVSLFNYGSPGAGLFTNLLHLRRLLYDGIHPNLVLIEVMPSLLYDQGGVIDLQKVLLPTLALRHDELGLLRRYSEQRRSEVRTEWWTAQASPIYHHRFDILSSLAPSLVPFQFRNDYLNGIQADGWFPLPPVAHTPEGRRKAAQGVLRDHAELKKFALSQARLSPLHEALLLCRNEGIDAVVLLMPEGPLLQGMYPQGDLPRIDKLVENCCRAWSVPFINAQNWFPSEEEFYDSLHLLPRGAQAFSRRLSAALVALPLLDRKKATREGIATLHQ